MIRNWLVLATMFLTSCSDVGGDLDDYFEEVKRRPAGKVEGIPEYPPYESFIYQAMNKRAPFERPQLKIDLDIDFTPNVKPETDRPSMPLEAFSVEELQLVGRLSGNGGTWGLVKDPDGMVHRIDVGDYIGRNFGKVTAIEDEYLSFIELIPAGQELWRERPRSLLLNSEAGN